MTRNFGMGADQVLSARIVLASGEVVNASPCKNEDIFYAIRGGGPSTYGVVTQIIVKTYPTANMHLFYVNLWSEANDTIPHFLDAMTTMYTSLPGLSAIGFAGCGDWVAHSTDGLGDLPYINVWSQAFTITGESDQEAQALFQPFQDKLMTFNASGSGINLNITKSSYPTYGSYFANKTGSDAEVGGISALSSRFLDTTALMNETRLRQAMEILGSEPGKPVYHTLVHHGLETTQGLQVKDSAVQPGWYNSIVLDIFERDVVDMNVADNVEPFYSIREQIEPVYRELAPSVGTYMNEADWGSVNWREDFFGIQWERLSEIKAKYDPESVFYCGTCVGSESWVVEDDGALCKVKLMPYPKFISNG
jgi:hypothetical protein